MNMKRVFTYTIEKDEDGFYIADVPDLPGCHTQAKTLDKLKIRTIEAIQLHLEETTDITFLKRFVGLQQVEVPIN